VRDPSGLVGQADLIRTALEGLLACMGGAQEGWTHNLCGRSCQPEYRYAFSICALPFGASVLQKGDPDFYWNPAKEVDRGADEKGKAVVILVSLRGCKHVPFGRCCPIFLASSGQIQENLKAETLSTVSFRFHIVRSDRQLYETKKDKDFEVRSAPLTSPPASAT
jgi:hypothetical protein